MAAASRILPVYRPENGMNPGPFGCVGIGVPFAIAAPLAYPDRWVLVPFGDGAFGFNGFEFDTAVRFQLNVFPAKSGHDVPCDPRKGSCS
ncbi:MAG: thiamine pyrophosphate-dependent enzyme [Thermoflexus sp.]|nr:thiamine pyrophosphate-dependent enzyme [Thermoflexus sp.]